MVELSSLRALLTGPIGDSPVYQLVELLHATDELVRLPDNDFTWSSWGNVSEASSELRLLIERVQNRDVPSEVEIGVIYAPTGPLQELSLSSGWADTFLRVADKYDAIAVQVWKQSRT